MVRSHKELAYPAMMILAMLAGSSVVLGIAFWGGVSKRFPHARQFLRRIPKGEYLERSLDSCRCFGAEKRFLAKVVGISIVLNTVWVFQVMTLSTGLDLHVPLIALFVIVPTIFCISALPICAQRRWACAGYCCHHARHVGRRPSVLALALAPCLRRQSLLEHGGWRRLCHPARQAATRRSAPGIRRQRRSRELIMRRLLQISSAAVFLIVVLVWAATKPIVAD